MEYKHIEAQSDAYFPMVGDIIASAWDSEMNSFKNEAIVINIDDKGIHVRDTAPVNGTYPEYMWPHMGYLKVASVKLI